VRAAALIRNAQDLLTLMPSRAFAYANPKNAVQTAISIPRSAPASAKSRWTSLATPPVVSSGTLTLAAASATPDYLALQANMWTSNSAHVCARLRSALVLMKFLTKTSAHASAAPRCAQTTTSGTVKTVDANALLCNALPISIGIRTIADANAASQKVAIPTNLIIIILIRKNAVASAPHQLTHARTMMSITTRNARVWLRPRTATTA